MNLNMKCPECTARMKQYSARTTRGRTRYTYHKCPNCGKEIISKPQFKKAKEKIKGLFKYTR